MNKENTKILMRGDYIVEKLNYIVAPFQKHSTQSTKTQLHQKYRERLQCRGTTGSVDPTYRPLSNTCLQHLKQLGATTYLLSILLLHLLFSHAMTSDRLGLHFKAE